MIMGYVIVNPRHPDGPVVCDEESRIWRDRQETEQEAQHCRSTFSNPDITVCEVVSPGQEGVGKKKVLKEGSRMKKFRIVYSARGSVVVEADGEDDAEEMFMDGQVDFGFDGATIDYIEEITEGETSPR